MLTIAEVNPQTVHLGWIIVSGLLSGIIGGLVGAFLAGYRLGSWRQRVDDRLDELGRDVKRHDDRLVKGDDLIDKIPVLLNEMEHLATELHRASENLPKYVTRTECDLRHGQSA